MAASAVLVFGIITLVGIEAAKSAIVARKAKTDRLAELEKWMIASNGMISSLAEHEIINSPTWKALGEWIKKLDAM
jgi:hypothetical protein